MEIHLIAPKDKNKWPTIWHKCYKIWELSSYKVRLWDDDKIDNLLIEDDIEFYNNHLNKLPPIYKFDYVRYLILSKYGGGYFDMDVELNIDFIPYLNLNTIYIAEGQDIPLNMIDDLYGEYKCKNLSNHIIISPLGKKNIFKEIKNRIKLNILKYSKIYNGESFRVVEVVGPIAISRIFEELQINHSLLSYHQFDISTEDVFSLAICKHHKTLNWLKK